MSCTIEERRVYTDERLPRLEVHNDGHGQFTVFYEGRAVDSFASREQLSVTRTSEGFAKRRAQDYFDRVCEDQEPFKPVAGSRIDMLIESSLNAPDARMAGALQKQAAALMARQQSVGVRLVREMLES